MQSVKEGKRQKSLSNVLESWHEAEKQLAIIIDKWPYASHVARKKRGRCCKVVILNFFSKSTKNIHPKYYKHLKKGAPQRVLNTQNWAGFW